jgi:hypothetical protein
MLQPADVAAAVLMIACLPPRAHIAELIIKPVVQDFDRVEPDWSAAFDRARPAYFVTSPTKSRKIAPVVSSGAPK